MKQDEYNNAITELEEYVTPPNTDGFITMVKKEKPKEQPKEILKSINHIKKQEDNRKQDVELIEHIIKRKKKPLGNTLQSKAFEPLKANTQQLTKDLLYELWHIGKKAKTSKNQRIKLNDLRKKIRVIQ